MREKYRAARSHPKQLSTAGRVKRSTKVLLATAFSGIAITAITTVVTKAYTSVDKKISAPARELSVTAKADHLDQNYTLAFRDPYTLTQHQVDLSANDVGSHIDELENQFLADEAVYPFGMIVTLRVANLSQEPVRIINVRTTDLVRTLPLRGALVYLPPQGGVETMPMALNLDDRGSPNPYEVDSAGKVRGPFFNSKEVSLQNREITTLKVFIATGKYSATFKLALDYLVGTNKKLKTQPANLPGKTFHVTAYNCTRSRLFSYQRLYAMSTPSNPQYGLRLVAPNDLANDSSELCKYNFAHAISVLYNS